MATCFESYLSTSTNHFMRQGDTWCGRMSEGVFKFSSHTAGLGREIAHLKGDTDTAGKLNAIACGFGAARSTIGAIRLIFPLHKLFTGQMFWETEMPEAVNAGSQITEIWKTHREEYVVRNWMDIAMDVLTLVARIIAPLQWLHDLKVIDLGRHAKGFSGASMGLWGAVLAMNMVQVTRDLVRETKVELVKKRVWDGIQSGIDLVALPFDFGLGASHPALAITGAVINMLSAGTALARDALS